jgi:hypothetical protein
MDVARATQALPQRQRLRGVCAECRSVLFKMDPPEADLKYSIFNQKYSIVLKALFSVL